MEYHAKAISTPAHLNIVADFPEECKAIAGGSKHTCQELHDKATLLVKSCHTGKWCEYHWSWYWWKCDISDCSEYDFCSATHRLLIRQVDGKTLYSMKEVRRVLEHFKEVGNDSNQISSKCYQPISSWQDAINKEVVDDGNIKQKLIDMTNTALFDAMTNEWYKD